MNKPISALKIAACLLFFSLAVTPASFGWPWSKTPEQKLIEFMTPGLNSNRQKFFNAFHPVGTATQINVHQIVIVWKNNIPSDNMDNIVGFWISFTIYWTGPLTSDGFTKVMAYWDNESLRWTGSKIIATNGVTNAQANQAAFDIGWMIGENLSK